MAFPTSPTNGQQATINGILYSYASATRSWTRIPTSPITTTNLTVTANATISSLTVNNSTTIGTTLGVAGNVTAAYFLGNGSQLTGVSAPAFTTVNVATQSDILANSTAKTLTFVAGTGVAITTDANAASLTISQVSTSGPFATSGDFGGVADAVTVSEDEGAVDVVASITYDLGSMVLSGLIYPDQLVLPSYTVSTLPSASVIGAFIMVTNDVGGSVPAFADGTNWRRVTDRNIIS